MYEYLQSITFQQQHLYTTNSYLNSSDDLYFLTIALTNGMVLFNQTFQSNFSSEYQKGYQSSFESFTCYITSS